jgi:hypothetical protein
MKEACEILTVLMCSFIVCIIIAGIVTIIRRIRIDRYCDMLGIGCIVTKVSKSENPFVEPSISEYIVVDKKWSQNGACWVQLHRMQDKSSSFDRIMKAEELYDSKYTISYPKK